MWSVSSLFWISLLPSIELTSRGEVVEYLYWCDHDLCERMPNFNAAGVSFTEVDADASFPKRHAMPNRVLRLYAP